MSNPLDTTASALEDTDIEDAVHAAEADALARIAAAPTVDALLALRPELVGKRAPLGVAKQRLGRVDPARRRDAGRAVNDAMASVTRALEARRLELAGEARARRLESDRLDLTEVLAATVPRRGHLHPVTAARWRLEEVFVGLGFSVAEGPEVETDWHNFEALNMGPGHPARSEFDTLFVDYGAPVSTVLRTHTSPVQIRTMLVQEPPIYIVAPGRVFRRDTPDATHMPVFHQLEGLVIDRGIHLGHLAGTIQAFTEAFFGPDFGSRLRPSYFPFTEPSGEFDIQRPDGTWLELGGCGMVHPNVLRNCGLDPEVWSGFAFGFGIDRMAKEFNGVDDLRDLFTNDVRVLEQF